MPATIRVIANGAGRSVSARRMVGTLSISAPMINASRHAVEAPQRTNEGAMTDEQKEQNGCGSANAAPKSEPVNPGRLTYDSKYAGSTVRARPDNRIPSIVACQTFSR